ncbi:hypothetical protein JCM10207_006323 [Rhodosporidiobolus poonsookiae]
MSSYLNSLPPPPPPPRTAGTGAGSAAPSASPPLDTDTSTAPPASQTPQRRTHKHSQSTHWNDTPDLGLPSAGGPRKRERVTSRAFAPSLAATPEAGQSRRASASPSPSPQAPAPRVLPGDAILPAFQAPPPPPPEPVLSRRYGPRGLPADVLHFPSLSSSSSDASTSSASSTTKLVLLFLPGNPGLVNYYTAFLSSLRNALPSPLRETTEIYAVGHLGHSTAPGLEGRGFRPQEQASLDEQVEDKVRFVDELRGGALRVGQEGGARCVVLGHSIGAWVGMQLIKQRPSLTALHMLFPTLSHMASTPNGRKLSPLFSSWTLRPVFYSTTALSYLPTALTSKLVGLLTGQVGPGMEVTTRLVSSPQTVLAALTMAREELATVTELDGAAVGQLAREGKLWIYYAAEGVDGWVTEDAAREVERTVEDAVGREQRERRVRRCIEGMPHAYVLDEAHSASLARKCAGWIVEDLASLDSAAPGDQDTSA